MKSRPQFGDQIVIGIFRWVFEWNPSTIAFQRAIARPILISCFRFKPQLVLPKENPQGRVFEKLKSGNLSQTKLPKSSIFKINIFTISVWPFRFAQYLELAPHLELDLELDTGIAGQQEDENMEEEDE